MINVLHINENIEIIGGVEVYLEQLLKYFPQYNLGSFWFGIKKTSGYYTIVDYQSKERLAESEPISNIGNTLNKFIKQNSIGIIHVHSVSDPKLIILLQKLAPLIRSMHEPRMFCPGHGKFWRKSETICNIPFGFHCIYHTYLQGCSNRHPKRLIKAYTNTKFEIKNSSSIYSKIIVMSNYMRDEAIKAGMDSNYLTVNPYFTPFISNNQIIDNSGQKEKHILFVGRLSTTKGVHFLIKAGIKLLEKKHRIIIDIVGDGHDRNLFEKMVPGEYTDKIIFHGWKSREEIHEFLNNCYILAFPSIYPEAFGISGIEAMMHGKPVVGFDVGGVSTWLTDNKTGFLVKTKDVHQFAEKMEILLTDTKIYHSFSKNARDEALLKFTPEVHLKKLISIYKKALQK